MSVRSKAVFLDFGTMGPEVDVTPLQQVVDLHCFDASAKEDINQRLAGARVAIVNKTKLSREQIERADALELIVLAATGTDNVDLAAAKDSGVAVANIRDYCSPAVAQHVFALILTLNQGIVGYDRLAKSGEWTRSRSFAMFDYPIRELAGRKLGLVGYGALGQAVARIGEGFGMEILVSVRPGHERPLPPDRVPFETVIETSDVLSLHCPLNDATRHLLSTEQFRRMQNHAIVINTARGALIDQHALVAALKAGHIGGAGIDVLPVEPPPADDPLLEPGIPNLLLTPHIAWASIESRQRAIRQLAENIEGFYAGRSVRRVV